MAETDGLPESALPEAERTGRAFQTQPLQSPCLQLLWRLCELQPHLRGLGLRESGDANLGSPRRGPMSGGPRMCRWQWSPDPSSMDFPFSFFLRPFFKSSFGFTAKSSRRSRGTRPHTCVDLQYPYPHRSGPLSLLMSLYRCILITHIGFTSGSLGAVHSVGGGTRTVVTVSYRC